MTTPTPEPEPPVEYPSQWRPRHTVERDDALEPLAIELHLAALSPAELQSTLMRVRSHRR